MSERAAFDPSRYLTKVGGKDYLEVRWRLVWLREVDPQARVMTMIVDHRFEEFAIFRAEITLSDGASGSGYGSETPKDFRDYVEKAETKAIGRALAALGFGTQFCDDFHYETNPDRPVVDSPVDRSRTQSSSEQSNTYNNGNGQSNGNSSNASVGTFVTPRQLKFIQAIAREKGMSDDELNAEITRAYGKATVAELDRRDASAFIDRLQSRRPVTELAS